MKWMRTKLMRLRKRGQRGFTLMELMVVIVIVAILAAVAVPLYINYVRDAQLTEARGAIGAVITAQQAFLQQNLGQAYAADIAALETAGQLDIQEAQANWTFTTSATGNTGFDITATNIADNTLTVTYNFTRAGGGTWTP